MSDAVIEVRGLRKSYGDFEAVRGIDLNIQKGEVFAMLGPNGAGKTTTVEILEGFRSRTAGKVSVLGSDPADGGRRHKEQVGIVLQTTGVEPYLTVAETLDQYRGYYSRPLPTAELLRLVGLEEQRDSRVRRLSGGQQRRLDVAIGLAGDPDLLFLDEPTTGFDPAARRGAWEMVSGLRRLGKTVVLTTHYMDEAQALADRVAIMARGTIIREGTPRELTGGAANTSIRFRLPAGTALPPEFEAAATGAGEHVIATDHPTASVHTLTAWALDRGVELEDLSVGSTSLEEVYLHLTHESEDAS
jgi:ABC-2 type transport system ATP-binding protein